MVDLTGGTPQDIQSGFISTQKITACLPSHSAASCIPRKDSQAEVYQRKTANTRRAVDAADVMFSAEGGRGWWGHEKRQTQQKR